MIVHKPSQSKVIYLDQKLDQPKKPPFLPIKAVKLDQKLDQNRKRNSLRFTDLSIKHINPEKDKRVIYWSEGKPDFGVRVSPTGGKTWVFEYRLANRTRRMSLGKYPLIPLRVATQLCYEAFEKVSEGIDPLDQKQSKRRKQLETPTLEELILKYVTHSKNTGKKTYEDEERCFQKELPCFLKKQRITEVSYIHLAEVFHDIIERGSPSTATHLFSYTRRLFNFAGDKGLMKYSENPCLEIKLKIPKRKRQRHLNPMEIHKFWNTIDQLPTSPIIRLAMRFLLLTVSRTIDIRKAKWSDIDMNGRIWTLPTSKNGRMHRVYLGHLAIEVLEQAKKLTYGDEFVFGSPRKYVEMNGRVTAKMLECRALAQPIYKNFEMFGIAERFTPHDLRRTGATLIAGLFGRRDFASLALNHTNNDATTIYDQYVYDREKKVSLEALNSCIDLIVNSPTIESVPSFEELRSQIVCNP